LHFEEHELAKQWDMREQACMKEERPEQQQGHDNESDQPQIKIIPSVETADDYPRRTRLVVYMNYCFS
jgi:hypothetical protein